MNKEKKFSESIKETISIMQVSNKMWNHTKPMTGKELEAMNSAYNRLLSKTPTKLK